MMVECSPTDAKIIRNFYCATTPTARAAAYDRLRQRMTGPDAAVFAIIHANERDKLAAAHRQSNPPMRTTWNPQLGRTETKVRSTP
jgi:hypothetical protein